MSNLENISHETMVFMRGKYRLDEIGDGKNVLKFKQDKKTVLTIYSFEDRFVFEIVFGLKAQRRYETQFKKFEDYIYPCHNLGKWIVVEVTAMEQLDMVKKLIKMKKKPNRKPFPKENAVYSKCGQRCDLCVHYVGTTDDQRTVMVPYLIKMWGTNDWSMRCDGCYSENCYCKDNPCNAKKCASEKCLSECKECDNFPCIKATSADHRSMIHTEVHYADEITWGILPYVPWQYEK